MHKNFSVVKAPHPYRNGNFDPPTMFLAGSIDMGKAVDWQAKVTKAVSDLPLTILNPRRDDWDSSWKQDISDPKFREQVEWELDALDVADIIVVYFDPEGEAPITLMELGLHVQSRIIVCCPEGYWRRGNVQVVCDRYDIPLVETLDELIALAREEHASVYRKPTWDE